MSIVYLLACLLFIGAFIERTESVEDTCSPAKVVQKFTADDFRLLLRKFARSERLPVVRSETLTLKTATTTNEM